MISDESSARDWLRQLPECGDLAWQRLSHFVELLGGENRRQNLVSAASFDQVWQRHIADSAQLGRFVPRGTETWLDLGTGAGFPGLVAAILRPEVAFTLVEARARRIDWLAAAARDLNLTNVRLFGGKAEALDRGQFDVISARAFAPLAKLLALAARFSTNESVWLLPKGRSGAQELAELKGWSHTFHVEQSLTDPSASVIVGSLIQQEGRR